MATKPTPANWRWLVEGSAVWYDLRGQWIAGTVLELGKNRKEHTRVCISSPGRPAIYREARELYFRKPELHGADIPTGNLTLAF